jgi:hypothetical protein
MTGPEARTAEQLRAEIRAERTRLDNAIGVFQADVKRVTRLAGSVLVTFAVARFVFRLSRNRIALLLLRLALRRR